MFLGQVLTIFSMVIAIAVLYLLARPVINGAIYFPTSEDHVRIVVKLSQAGSGKRIADLGSGDGRILLAFGQANAIVEGFEINPLLVLRSRSAIRTAGLTKNVSVQWRSFWKEDLSRFDVVYVFGFTPIMKRLGKKLKRDLRPGALVVSNIFKFPDWQPAHVEDGVYVYQVQ